MLLAAYLDHVGAALASKDGQTLAQLLSLTKNAVDVDLQPLSVDQLGHICQSKLARFDAFAEVITGMIQARKHIESHSFEDAYASQIASVMCVIHYYVYWKILLETGRMHSYCICVACSKFMEVFRGETNWVMPFLHVIILDTRLVAARVSHLPLFFVGVTVAHPDAWIL